MQSASDPRRRRHRRRRRARPARPPRTTWPQAGLDVLLLEKTAFPREKVCGDGLTPRAVRPLVSMGIDTSESAGWLHNKGLRIIGGGMRLELPVARAGELPGVRPGAPAQRLRRAARPAGGQGRRACCASGRRAGARPRRAHRPHRRRRPRSRRVAARSTYRAPLVVAADGNSSRLSPGDGPRRSATTARWASPSAPTTRARGTTTTGWSPGWSCGTRRETAASGCCPATAGSSASATAPSTSASASSTPAPPSGKVDYKDLLQRWLDQTPEEWGYREENRTQPIRGAALPMGFNRQPHYDPRPAARRRLRRHGQPVQRRGHRLRDGVRRDRRRGHRAGAGPADGRRRASGRCRPTRRP